jgi:hypothetical protein
MGIPIRSCLQNDRLEAGMGLVSTDHSALLPIAREFWLLRHMKVGNPVFFSIFVSDNFFKAKFCIRFSKFDMGLTAPNS